MLRQFADEAVNVRDLRRNGTLAQSRRRIRVSKCFVTLPEVAALGCRQFIRQSTLLGYFTWEQLMHQPCQRLLARALIR